MSTIEYFVGIDPGMTGAMAVIRRDKKIKALAVEMPLDAKRKEVNPIGIKMFLISTCGVALNEREFVICGSTVIILEKSQPMPKQGVTTMFHYGKTYGKIVSTLELMDIMKRVIEIRPAAWKKEFELNSNKQKSVRLAEKLFPEFKGQLKLIGPKGGIILKDGIAEALLMAEYGRRKYA